MAEQRSALTPQFVWLVESRRFRDIATGRFVPAATVRQALDTVVDGVADRLRATSQQLVDGQISARTWQLEMSATMKSAHLAAAASASGGWQTLSSADYGFVGSRLKVQYGYLRNLADDVASGKQVLGPSLLARAALYGHAARATGREMERREARLAGNAEARRVLGIADHCRDCVAEAARGWQSISDLRAIGDSVCRTSCRCHFTYRRAA